jgi:hypothetical protein
MRLAITVNVIFPAFFFKFIPPFFNTSSVGFWDATILRREVSFDLSTEETRGDRRVIYRKCD